MVTGKLDMLSEDLDLIAADVGIADKMTGVRLDKLFKIIRDYEENPVLREVFGEQVTHRLAIVAFFNDLRIIDTQDVRLTDEQKTKVSEELNKILKNGL